MSGNCRQESQYLIFWWAYTWLFFVPRFKWFSHAEPDKYHHCGNPHWALGHFLFDLHEQNLHKFPLQLTLVACRRVTYFVLLSLINKVIQFQNIFSFYPFGRVVEISSGSNYHGISEFPSLWWMAVSSMYVKKENISFHGKFTMKCTWDTAALQTDLSEKDSVAWGMVFWTCPWAHSKIFLQTLLPSPSWLLEIVHLHVCHSYIDFMGCRFSQSLSCFLCISINKTKHLGNLFFL